MRSSPSHPVVSPPAAVAQLIIFGTSIESQNRNIISGGVVDDFTDNKFAFENGS